MPKSITLTKDEAESLTWWIADVACWFRGFMAAKDDAQLPPGLGDLVEFNGDLKRKIDDLDRDANARA